MELKTIIRSALALTAVVYSMVGTGCRPSSQSVTNGDIPQELPHRYEECILLDKAAINTWQWRPLPDSLCLEGYSGLRFIARLKNIPMPKGGPGYLLYRADCELAGKESDLASLLQPAGGIQDSDVVWDIFWKTGQVSPQREFKFKQRFIRIEERKDSVTVNNRSVVEDRSIQLPEGSSLTPDGDATYRALKVRFGEKQNLFTLKFQKTVPDPTKSYHENTAAELKWYWATGEPK
jgi:hypothetical protein